MDLDAAIKVPPSFAGTTTSSAELIRWDDPLEIEWNQVERDPDLELGGCMISPTFWTVKCKDCGHEIILGETMSIFRGDPGDA